MAEEEIVQDVAAESDPGDNNTGVTDDILNQAAADAVETQTETLTEEEQVTEEADEQVVETETDIDETETKGVDEEGLPVEHKKRSDLGRKISALHNRQDNVDERLNRILDVLEKQSTIVPVSEQDTFDEIDPSEPITYGEMEKYLEQKERAKKDKANAYDKKYLETFATVTKGMSEDEVDEIVEEMKNLPYKPSNDPSRDAELNFLKADRSLLRKQLAKPQKKVNPIEGKESKTPLGTTTTQKVVGKEVNLPKLDAAGMSYLAFVEREDGSERATELHKSVGKG